MMNYDRTLIEAQKAKVYVPRRVKETDYGTFLLMGLGVLVIILLFFG